jgi:hypothetical protein
MNDAVSESCKIEDFQHAISAAKALGMISEGHIGPFTLKYNFKAEKSPHEYVRFHFRSYDQSQSFSIQPDMNKFELELIIDGKTIRSRYEQYED